MKACVIGSGFGQSVVARHYDKCGIETEVVSPRDPEAVRRACAAPVDFVSVHSPPFLHREHVLLALEYGRNVVCDKPFGRSVADARDMADAATAAGVVHLINFEFRHNEVRGKIKELIDEGAIGKPLHLQWSMFNSASRSMPHGWVFDEALGGGWIRTYGSHVIDALRWWIGEIEDVVGVCRTDIPMRTDSEGRQFACDAEDAFSACFTFSSGATAIVDTSFASAVTRPQRMELLGSDGVLVLEGVTKLDLMRTGETTRSFSFPPNLEDPHELSFMRWVPVLRDAIAEKRQIAPSFFDGLACADVMQRLREKAIWPPAKSVSNLTWET